MQKWTAARGFIGEEWLKWLIDNNIPIDIRIPERLSQFFVLVDIAFIWVMKTGMEVAKKKLVAIKKLKHNRPQKSIFRLGMDTLQETSWKRLTKLLNWSVNLLSPALVTLEKRK